LPATAGDGGGDGRFAVDGGWALEGGGARDGGALRDGGGGVVVFAVVGVEALEAGVKAGVETCGRRDAALRADGRADGFGIAVGERGCFFVGYYTFTVGMCCVGSGPGCRAAVFALG
jgi:hypothetical protein